MIELHPKLSLPIGDVYSTLAVLLLFGATLGYLAARFKLPSITGNMLAGILLGPVLCVVNTHDPTIEAQMEPLTNLALSLIAISIGSHLRLQLLHNAFKRVLVIGFLGSIVSPIIVFSAIYLCLGLTDFPKENAAYISLFMAVLSIATASATVAHVIKEANAKGLLVKTIIAVVVINNVTNVFFYEVLRHWFVEGGATQAVSKVIVELGWSIGLGVGVAFLLLYAWKKSCSRKKMVSISLASIVVTYGLAIQFGLSPVLANLALGVTIANLSDRNQILDIFEDFEGIIYSVFFTLVGTHASFANLGSVGILTAVYLIARFLGNLGTVYVSGLLMRLPRRISKYLGLSMTPQAGITVGFVVGLEAIDPGGAITKWVTPSVLMAITISEIIGPLILRIALRRTGEEGNALPRLIDFIQEEYITVPLKARSRTGVIEELVDQLCRTHSACKSVDRADVLQAVLDREERGSTAMGYGVAIPHGRIPRGPKIVGVMGVIPEGIRWSEDDDYVVHMVILIATPPEHEIQHIGALSTISRLFRGKSVTQRGLHLAKTAAEVYEALAGEELDSINQVIKDEFTPSELEQFPGFERGDHPRPTLPVSGRV